MGTDSSRSNMTMSLRSNRKILKFQSAAYYCIWMMLMTLTSSTLSFSSVRVFQPFLVRKNAKVADECPEKSSLRVQKELRKKYLLHASAEVSPNSIVDGRRYHAVNGIQCVEVTINIEGLGPVTILEATAEAQEDLVNMALEEDVDEAANTLHSGDPYGAVLWPAASSVAAHLLQSSRPLTSVLELGAGTGLVSIAAKLGGAHMVIATDYEDIPLQLLEYAATHLNLNCHEDSGRKTANSLDIQTSFLDMCDYQTPLPEADVVVAADIMYEPKTGRAMAQRAFEALERGSRVIIGDSPGRPGRAAFLQELALLLPSRNDLVFRETVGTTCSGDRHELICGKESLSVSQHTPKLLSVSIMDLLPER